jgi:hypothetical protein
MSTNAGLFDFMIGEWSVEFNRLPEGARVGRRALATVDRFLDNTAILDQWRHVDESGTGRSFSPFVAFHASRLRG